MCAFHSSRLGIIIDRFAPYNFIIYPYQHHYALLYYYSPYRYSIIIHRVYNISSIPVYHLCCLPVFRFPVILYTGSIVRLFSD